MSPDPREHTERRDPLIGANLGGYVVKHWIGQGGMGVVYLAEQPDIGRAVAIKVLKPDIAADPDHLKRLVEEARTVNAIRHRGIIDIFGFGATPAGRQYIVMEYLEGQPLDAYLAGRGKLTPSEVAAILDEVLSALAAAHKAGVVHRDLKPGNIFVALQSDGAQYVKVLDFGLAKKAQRPHGSAAQTNFRPVGTPEYMAPEQARGESVNPRTDLYAVGIIAFELLTGDIPFNAPSVVEILMKQMQDPVPSLRALEPAVPVAFEELVFELLAKDAKDRPPSAEVVRRRLKQLARELQDANTGIVQLAPTAEVKPEALRSAPQSNLEPLSPLTRAPVRAAAPDTPVNQENEETVPPAWPVPAVPEPTRIAELKALGPVPVAQPPAHEPTVVAPTERVPAARAAPTHPDLSGRRRLHPAIGIGAAAGVLAVAVAVAIAFASRPGPAERPKPAPVAVEPPAPKPVASSEPIHLEPSPAEEAPPVRPVEAPPPVAPEPVRTPVRPKPVGHVASKSAASKSRPVLAAAEESVSTGTLKRRVDQLASAFDRAERLGKNPDPMCRTVLKAAAQNLGHDLSADARRRLSDQLESNCRDVWQ